MCDESLVLPVTGWIKSAYFTLPTLRVWMKTGTTLLDDARRMDGEALATIFDLYASAIYKYAFRFCNDALMADQIVGDVFTKLLEHLSAGHGPRTNLRSYLFEMAYHIVIDEGCYSDRRVSIEAAELAHRDGYSTDISVENRISFGTVWQAIQNDLTQDQRHVVILRFLERFSLDETASIMGMKAGNVKVAQHRAITALRKALDHRLMATHAVQAVPGDQAKNSLPEPRQHDPQH